MERGLTSQGFQRSQTSSHVSSLRLQRLTKEDESTARVRQDTLALPSPTSRILKPKLYGNASVVVNTVNVTRSGLGSLTREDPP